MPIGQMGIIIIESRGIFFPFVFPNYVMGINHFCVVSDSVLLLGNLAHLSWICTKKAQNFK
jgi:hypothetical protein